MNGESLKILTAAGEDMKVRDPERVSRVGLSNGGELEEKLIAVLIVPLWFDDPAGL